MKYYRLCIVIFVIISITWMMLLYTQFQYKQNIVTEIYIKNVIKRYDYLNCLRNNKIDFATKDNGIILIFAKPVYKKICKFNFIIYTKSIEKTLEYCPL